ncbi:molybdenum cofactor guanylyltransferase [Paludifilum halophilum]|uniref:molybdenum cofactor guanylyltransferase n=1 Tax=Paludifilum halophilum TaxID=1642702 RepID=UPI00146C4870|nr:molybdenum cofactor guanylyltransferase [Paludifilum halophilum]
MEKNPERGVILLAGGESRRMGRDKFLLPFKGESMGCRILRRLKGIGNPVIVAGAGLSCETRGIPVVSDRYPGQGPLAGIHAGLSVSTCGPNLVVACDMPFASPELARLLFSRSEGVDAVVPQDGERTHPLFAVYQRRCLPVLERRLYCRERRVTDFLQELRVGYVDREEMESCANPDRALFNMNRPREWSRALSFVEQSEETGHREVREKSGE